MYYTNDTHLTQLAGFKPTRPTTQEKVNKEKTYHLRGKMVNISRKNESVYVLPQLIYAFQSQLQKPVSSVGELLYKCVGVWALWLHGKSGPNWFNFPQDPEIKISLAIECAAQYTEHIMLLWLWRQINSCNVGNKAERQLMCHDHMTKSSAWHKQR